MWGFRSDPVRLWRPSLSARPEDDPVNVHLFFVFIEQLLSRTTDLPLFAIPAGQLSSHKSIAEETEDKQSHYECEDSQGKLLHQEYYTCENGNNKHQKIRDNIFPCDLFLVEPLRLTPLKEQGAQPPFTKSTGFAVIITVHAMPAYYPEFKEKNEKYITDDPDETKPVQNACANNVDQE
jgi:hypothetical protein